MNAPVFDTNVLFAAQVANGVCAALYQEVLQFSRPVISIPILDELEEKLVTKLLLSPEDAARTRRQIAAECQVVEVTPLFERACRDPDDDIVLATALCAGSDLIVTGDKDLLVLKSYKGVQIVTPADCLRLLRERFNP